MLCSAALNIQDSLISDWILKPNAPTKEFWQLLKQLMLMLSSEEGVKLQELND